MNDRSLTDCLMLQDKSKPDTKATIRDESRALFAARGYEAVSMRDIANAIAMRPSAIYNHFPSKQALLADLMEGHMVRVVGEMTAVLDGVSDPIERLKLFARHHLLIHLDYKDDVFLAYYEIRGLDEEMRRHIVALRDRYEGLLRNLLTDGKSSGLFTIGDPAVHARAILAMLTGVTIWYRDGGRLSRELVIGTYERAVLQGVGLSCPPPADES
jgi:AcrR family transcriptional regulator